MNEDVRLRRWFEAHQREYPIPELDFASFSATATATAHDETRSLDLYLVMGCLMGSPAAPKHLLRRHHAAIDGALRRLRMPADRADEVRSTFYELLFVGEAGTPALQRYTGHGSLDGWLRVTVSRSAHRLLRRTERLELRDPEALAEIWHSAERDSLIRECKGAFRAAMDRAFGALSDEDREALRDHYVGGRSIDALARVWGVHRATAARRLARLRWQLRERVLGELEATMGITPSSALRMVRTAQSQLGSSLGLLEGECGGSTPE